MTANGALRALFILTSQVKTVFVGMRASFVFIRIQASYPRKGFVS